MEVRVAVVNRAVQANGRLYLRPIHATLWNKAGDGDESAKAGDGDESAKAGDGDESAKAEDGDESASRTCTRTDYELQVDGELDRLRDAIKPGSTVWLEASLVGLEEDAPSEEKSDLDELAWYGGSFNVWKPKEDVRPVDWAEMKSVLKLVSLESPQPTPAEEETITDSLLRAIPYVFTRGTFGTVRDVLSDRGELTDDRDEDAPDLSDARLAVFPTVGFSRPDEDGPDPDEEDPDRKGPVYTTIRTMVGAVGRIVITVRLPDVLCAAKSDVDAWESDEVTESLDVPRRFFPLYRVPRGREVAESIGIHQAATVRAVANEARKRLTHSQRLAEQLRRTDRRDEAKRRDRRDELLSGSEETDRLAEIVDQLDQRISRLLRRFGGETVDAPKPAVELVPPEVEKGYRFALDEVKSLRREHRRTSRAVTDALSIYDQENRERFQHIAAILASFVLIPTLVASFFGVKFPVPEETSKSSFYAFLALVVSLAFTGFYALRIARKHDWSPGWRRLLPPGILAAVIVAGFVLFLRFWV